MADEKKAKVNPVRVIIRVQVPKIDPSLAGEVHAAITAALTPYKDAEIELSMMPTVPTR